MKNRWSAHLILIVFVCISFIFQSLIIRADKEVSAYEALGSGVEFQCVGKLIINRDVVCSCVLISDSVALTSSHCLYEKTRKKIKMKARGKTYITWSDELSSRIDLKKISLRWGKEKIRIREVIVHKDYNEFNPQADIAILYLDKKVPGIHIPQLDTFPGLMQDTVYLCGNGETGNSDYLEIFPETKLAVMNVLDSSGNAFGWDSIPYHLFTDLDRTGYEKYNISGSESPLELEGTSTLGDSGGGMFRYHEGRWVLCGIISGNKVHNILHLSSGEAYNYLQFGTSIPYFYSWIAENTAKP